MTPPGRLGTLAAAMQERGMRRVLDLGCGAGRDLVFLSGQDFETHGIDIDFYALAGARVWLEQEGLFARLAVVDMEALPYPNAFFDAVISMFVINCNLVDGIRRTVAGVHRTLRPGGWFFATVTERAHFREGCGTEIEPATWLVRDRRRNVQVPYHLSHEDELYSLWEGFRFLKLERMVRNHVNVHSGEFCQIVYWEVWAEKV